MGDNKAKGEVKVKVERKPIKAGSSMPRNVGGILNRKFVAILKRKRRK